MSLIRATMLFQMWTLVFFLLSRVDSSCPPFNDTIKFASPKLRKSPCYCSDDATVIDCSYVSSTKSLERFLHRMPKSHFLEWVVYDSDVETLSNPGNLACTSLNVQSNRLLRVVGEQFFDTLTDLTDITMMKNSICAFPFHSLRKLRNLRYLNLLGNRLTHIPPRAFQGLTSLSYLDLSYNYIMEIGGYAFADVASLENLHLIGNKLERLSPASLQLHCCSSKTHPRMYLSGNHIRELPAAAFGNGSLPYALDISRNLITRYDVETFLPLIQNILRAPTTRAFLSYGNPVPCDCNVLWIYSVGRANPMVRRVLDFYCYMDDLQDSYENVFDLSVSSFLPCFRNESFA